MHEVFKTMTLPPKPDHDFKYSHDEAIKNLTIPEAVHDAIRSADDLHRKVCHELKLWLLDCVSAVIAPKRWLLGTGTPHDLTSVNSAGSKIIARKTEANAGYQLNVAGGVTPVKWKAPT